MSDHADEPPLMPVAAPPATSPARVRRPRWHTAGFAGAMVAGLVLLMIAAVLALRWRGRRSTGRKLERPTGA